MTFSITVQPSGRQFSAESGEQGFAGLGAELAATGLHGDVEGHDGERDYSGGNERALNESGSALSDA